MKKSWRILLLLMISCLCCSIAKASNLPDSRSGDFGYKRLPDGTVQITRYYGKEDSIVLPDTLGGYAVTGIDDRAFHNCIVLKSIAIPDCIIKIGANPFTNCSSLENIWVSPDHPVLTYMEGVLFNKEERKLICYLNASKEQEYEVPLGVRVIGDYAFFDCDFLRTVTLNGEIDSIGESSFSGCDNLTNVYIQNGVSSIGKKAFFECSGLAEINLPDSISYIGKYAFSDCTVLRKAMLPGGLEKLEEGMFCNCISLKTISMPETLKTIEKRAFANCGLIRKITLSRDVAFIAVDAFDGCSLNLLFVVNQNSYSAQWCKENIMNHVYPNTFDWLNETKNESK